jgi:SNF family Na+-dependent transporter
MLTSLLFLLCAVVEYTDEDFDWRKSIIWVAIAILFFVSSPKSDRAER